MTDVHYMHHFLFTDTNLNSTAAVATGISPGAAAAATAVAEQHQGNSTPGVARQPAVNANAAAGKEESAVEATPREDSCFQER